MPRLMSFSMTERAVLERRKTVTRRLGWHALKPGDELRAVRKVMGRRRGEPIVDLARIRVVSVRREPLSAIEREDVIREGFAPMSPEEFVALFCEEMRCTPETAVARIEFEYLEEPVP